MTIESILLEAYNINQEIKVRKKRLQEINLIVQQTAKYKENSSTGHIYTKDIHAKVTKKTNQKWNQDLLDSARKTMGNDTFFRIFNYEFTPKSKRALDGFLEYGDQEQAALIRKAVVESEGSPHVVYEKIENEE